MLEKTVEMRDLDLAHGSEGGRLLTNSTNSVRSVVNCWNGLGGGTMAVEMEILQWGDVGHGSYISPARTDGCTVHKQGGAELHIAYLVHILTSGYPLRSMYSRNLLHDNSQGTFDNVYRYFGDWQRLAGQKNAV